VKCPSCGADNKPDAVFCMACGARFPRAPSSRTPGVEGGPGTEGVTTIYYPGSAGEGTMPIPWTRDEGAERPRGERVEAPGEAPVETAPGIHFPIEEILAEPAERRKPDYYVPPEADYRLAASQTESPPREEHPPTETLPPPSLESTQAIPPVAGGATAAATPQSRVICPECYAPNAELNSYCQECGSALSIVASRQAAAARSAAGQAGYQQTAIMSTGMMEGAAVQPGYARSKPRGEKARGAKSFGVADLLALVSAVAVVLAIVPVFAWKKGIEIGIFSHQGGFSQGRTDLLGGPGILPYQGVEFFTVGLVAAVGLALVLVFLALRAGRGPMYLLAGSLLLFPLAYLFFQAVLPLRQMGINVQPALGLKGIFFGNAGNPGMGPPLWIISGAGVLLVLAGFLAPPRGWGRLFSFLLFFSVVLGAAFFCAACYNWNLFIGDSTLAYRGAGLHPRAVSPGLPILLR